MVTKDIKIAYSEVLAIINLMEEKYKNKIPNSVLQIFKDEKKENYNPVINIEESFLNQNLQRETLVILAILNLNYWCENEQEKIDLLKEYAENDKIKEEKLRKMYNPDNMFKNKNTERISENENKQLIEYKENMFKKIWNKIKIFFKRK
jgi:hypothetical protein